MAQLLEVYEDKDFSTTLTDLKSEANISLYSVVFPTMFKWMSPVLLYWTPSAKVNLKMNKEAFKTYFTYI